MKTNNPTSGRSGGGSASGWKHRLERFAKSLCVLFAFFGGIIAEASEPTIPSTLARTKNILIPDWGPFSKDFAGVSHVIGAGDRFDLSLMASASGKKPLAPDVLTATGFNPWEASADYRYHSYRMALDGDKLTATVSFIPYGDENVNARLVRVELANAQSQSHDVDLLSLMSLVPEPAGAKSLTFTASPPGVRIDSTMYSKLEYAKPPFDTHLAKDGFKPGEVPGSDWIGSRALGGKWGQNAGDCVSYETVLDKNYDEAVAWIRYRNTGASPARFQTCGLLNVLVELPPAKQPAVATVPVGALKAGAYKLVLTLVDDSSLVLDEIIIIEKSDANRIALKPTSRNDKPRIKQIGTAGFTLSYAERKLVYGFAWNEAARPPQLVSGSNVTSIFDRPISPSTTRRFISRGLLSDAAKAHYVAGGQSVQVPANRTVVHYALICTGNESTVTATIKEFSNTPASTLESSWLAERDRTLQPRGTLPAAKPYELGERLMTATTLMNIVYPECIDGEWIKHYTPGKRWNSLYTWDSGFIGIGLASIAHDRAIENLNTYLNGPEHHSAFIHHGTPLPIQIYQFMEIWNRNPDPELLRYFYPRLKRFYQFYAGRAEGSTTANLKSGLLRTWDYFYNSGGWDDYPPQRYLAGVKELRNRVTPVVSTATALRVAKILRTLAELSGSNADVADYDRDIAVFASSLQSYSWDAESGYYSYVQHDTEGHPVGILRHDSGANFNQGLDGLYPLVTGICTPEQRAKLIGHLFDPKRIWTPYGLSTVDQSAPYYSPDGYWNGAVWFPHQWVFWKALLDMGEPELAFRIANTGLENWRRLTTSTNNCYEHINIKDGKGDGCPHFSGLSTPVMNWFDTYYRIGSLTGGFDAVITKRIFSKSIDALEADITFGQPAQSARTLIVTLVPGPTYEARWNGELIPSASPHDGCLWLKISANATKGTLTIRSLK